MEAWLPMVREIGFPIVVTLYLLVRIEGKLENLTQSIVQLSHTLNRNES
ncbi:MAG: YvrJ family protein [Bacilli bacterium]